MKLSSFIIAENENWIALNKPSGLLSIPDREGKEVSLKSLLIEKYARPPARSDHSGGDEPYGRGNIYTVHRLDKDTSGLIVFAKNLTTHKHLSLQFEGRQTNKIYQGLVIGSLPEEKGSINSSIAEHPAKNGSMIIHRNGKESLTDFEVLEDYSIYSLVQFQIHTGRTHQIRVHMKDYGHPIVCDELYGDGKPVLISSFKKKYNLSKDELEERPILGRLALHSFQLGFKDIDGKDVSLEAELPKDMRATLQQLRKRKGKK